MRERLKKKAANYIKIWHCCFPHQEVREAQSLLRQQDEPSVKYKFHCILSAYNRKRQTDYYTAYELYVWTVNYQQPFVQGSDDSAYRGFCDGADILGFL